MIMKTKKDNAVSEVVGVMLMLSVTVILVSIVAVVVTGSAPANDDIIISDIKATEISNGNIIMELVGGDSFSLGKIKTALSIRGNESGSTVLEGSYLKKYSGAGDRINLGERFKIVTDTPGAVEFGDFVANSGDHIVYRIFDISGNAVSSGEITVP